MCTQNQNLALHNSEFTDVCVHAKQTVQKGLSRSQNIENHIKMLLLERTNACTLFAKHLDTLLLLLFECTRSENECLIGMLCIPALVLGGTSYEMYTRPLPKLYKTLYLSVVCEFVLCVYLTRFLTFISNIHIEQCFTYTASISEINILCAVVYTIRHFFQDSDNIQFELHTDVDCS
jgi:hypothetical protein